MAEQSLTTPGAFSRRSLFSVAAAVSIAAATGIPSPSTADPPANSQLPAEVLVLLVRYRQVGTRLQQAEADFAAALVGMPKWARPKAAANGQPEVRLPAWTRDELAALGLPDTMPLRPSMEDFHRFNRQLRDGPAELRADRKRSHRARVAAWKEKRREQKSWFARTGADAIERRRRRLLVHKHDMRNSL